MALPMPPEAVESAKKGIKVIYVVFAFCCALILGFLKALLVGPVAALLVILGNVGVLLAFFPAHVYWTGLTIIETSQINLALKLLFLLALPVLFGLWLVVGIAGSVLVGLGFGFFAPWVATFEAFRKDGERNKFIHCVTDGTWGTIRSSCTVVRDFADICIHSIPLYLKELRNCHEEHQPHKIRLVDVPAGIVVALTGLIVEIPMYTIIAVIKSPYMLFKGWQRLLHDLLSGEGPFLETACVPIAGLAIILWPLAVVGSILMAFLSSIFIGLYGAVIVYQERSFRRGLAYVVAMVAAFDEYTNDWLYLSEGSIFPRPQYRKRKASNSTELSVGPSTAGGGKFSSAPLDPPALLVPSLLPSRSVREAIQEVKMVQIWEELMMACEIGGKLFVDAHVITSADLNEWFKAKGNNQNGILDLGLPSYCLLDTIVFSMKAGSGGIVLSNGVEVNYLNRPQGKLFDWFFHPVMVLKEQIKAINMEEGEMRFLEKLVLLGSNTQRMQAWENGSVVPEDALRTAQIQGISRRLVGMAGSISKFPTYRRRFRHVMKVLLTHSFQKETSHISQLDRMERGSFRALGSLRGSRSVKPSSSIEAIHSEV